MMADAAPHQAAISVNNTLQKRIGRPFEKGRSGNPTGRPKGSVGFASRARQKTRDGRTVLEFLVAVVTNPTERTADRLAAAKMLLDRMYGRADQTLTLEELDNERPVIEVRWGNGTPEHPPSFEIHGRPTLEQFRAAMRGTESV
jgi:hypothetical protein